MNHDGGALLLTRSSGPLTAIAGQQPAFEIVDDVDRCSALLRANLHPVSLVVIGPDWPRPLSAAKQIRSADGTVGLAFVVKAEDVAAMRAKLAFFPDARNATVVDADSEIAQLQRRLLECAASSWRGQRLRGVLNAINRDLAAPASTDAESRTASAVSEHYLATLVRHAGDTIISTDPARRIVTINEAGQRTLGIDVETVEGRPLSDVLADHDSGRLIELLTAAENGPVQVDDELPLKLRNGHEVLLSATAAAIFDDDGSLAGLVIVARDVTAERRAEQRLRALQKAESLATLASGVAHDFNNLLVQAQGWAELARDDLDNRQLVAEALQHIGEAARQASELARAMLAYGGRGTFQPKRVQLTVLIEELLPLLSSSVPAKIRLVTDFGDESSAHADPTQIRQVIFNLVTNAAEAIGDRTGTILLRTGVRSIGTVSEDRGLLGLAEGSYAVIEVEDTGPGVGPDIQDRLFDPFFSTKFTGRGLGLAASQGIARAHGGVITVDGRPGRGALFRVHLPTVREAP